MTRSGIPAGTPARRVSTWVISLVASGTRICATVTPVPWIIAENRVTGGVVGGPCAWQDLAVRCNRQQVVGVLMCPLEEPRPDQQVQLPGVDALQHPSQC